MNRIARLWRSLTFRLALVYMGLFGLSVGLIFVGLYVIGVARPLQADGSAGRG